MSAMFRESPCSPCFKSMFYLQLWSILKRFRIKILKKLRAFSRLRGEKRVLKNKDISSHASKESENDFDDR